MKKIKILYSGESSGSSSGFGVYGYNVLSRLSKNPNFEIAEFASFSSLNDNKYKKANWLYYPNAVEKNHPEYNKYIEHPANKYGAWRFERVLLDFKPDIVFTIRDPWMMEHDHKSPLREYYHLAIMPTVDSVPQQHQWIEMFASADSVLTYCDWSIPELIKQSNGAISPICSAYPGVDFESFYPSTNKKEDKKIFDLPEDCFIIGTVMRNQRRKLLEDLFSAFSIFLNTYSSDITKKTYLLVHTSYPDLAGWNIPNMLKHHGIASKVYFTYLCQETKKIIITKFSGSKCYSPYSRKFTASFPNVSNGVSSKQLGSIYRTMDLYVQYATCEGFGMPQAEAAASGIPIASINYSAMADLINKTNGFSIPVKRFYYEWETNAYRAYPDNDMAAEIFYKYLSLSDTKREEKSKQALSAAKKYFDWDKTTKIWSDHFESIVLKNNQGKWNIPVEISTDIPQYEESFCSQMSNTEYIKFLCDHVAKDSSLFYKTFGLSLIEQLNTGVTSTFKNGQPINRKDVYEMMKIVGENKILCETARLNPSDLDVPDFIEFAHLLRKHNESLYSF